MQRDSRSSCSQEAIPLEPRPNLQYERAQMKISLNQKKGVIWGIIYGTIIVVITADTRNIVYSSDVDTDPLLS